MRISRTVTRPLLLPKRLPQRSLRTKSLVSTPAPEMSSLWHPRSQPHTHSLTPTLTPGFSSLFRFLDDFDKYAQQVAPLTAGSQLSTWAPRFDVAEHDKEYVLTGELPGVPPENVDVEFTDNQTLVVRGRVEREHTEGDVSLAEGGEGAAKQKEGKKGGEKEKEGPKYWLTERSFGEFSRVFSFPVPVNEDAVKANFKNGVLELRVPKAEHKKGTKKIPIQGN
ncbi:putative heat shock protein [Diplogelasinospora grovesii]|uniref:Heat shock protein n=1 Tax=Diplogelasinospora grovesii TaxID=303347 RepID=A0AAN6N6L2_9PEZI|nr:putative heat shock protein [Diplogelasinospora grovesii]